MVMKIMGIMTIIMVMTIDTLFFRNLQKKYLILYTRKGGIIMNFQNCIFIVVSQLLCLLLDHKYHHPACNAADVLSNTNLFGERKTYL